MCELLLYVDDAAVSFGSLIFLLQFAPLKMKKKIRKMNN
jgi:hypothetical protein